MTSRGMWLSSFQQDVAANRPTDYPGDADLAFFFATDTGALSLAVKPAVGVTAASWIAIADSGALALLTALPTTAPAAGGVWNDGGVLKAALT